MAIPSVHMSTHPHIVESVGTHMAKPHATTHSHSHSHSHTISDSQTVPTSILSDSVTEAWIFKTLEKNK